MQATVGKVPGKNTVVKKRPACDERTVGVQSGVLYLTLRGRINHSSEEGCTFCLFSRDSTDEAVFSLGFSVSDLKEEKEAIAEKFYYHVEICYVFWRERFLADRGRSDKGMRCCWRFCFI